MHLKFFLIFLIIYVVITSAQSSKSSTSKTKKTNTTVKPKTTTTTRKQITTTKKTTTTTRKPLTTTLKPATTTKKPLTTTTKLEIKTTKPEIKTSEPEITSSKPTTITNSIDMDIKAFNALLDTKRYPKLTGSVHAIACPIINKELEKELLCGLDPKYSTSKIIFYSGFIQNTAVPNIFIACVDLIVTNMLENVDTEYLWHGKCYFYPFPSASEVYKNFSMSLDKNDQVTQFEIKSEQNLLYKASLPPLSDPSYIVDRPKDTLMATQHIHLFSKFYSVKEESYCNANLSTAIMNINFMNFEGVYYSKLKNLDDITMTEDYGKFLGLNNFSGKKDLDETKCASSFWIDFSFMDTQRSVSVYKNTTVPVKPTDKSLSKINEFPYPFDKMSDEIIKKLTLDKNTTRYNLNEKIMEFMDEY